MEWRAIKKWKLLMYRLIGEEGTSRPSFKNFRGRPVSGDLTWSHWS